MKTKKILAIAAMLAAGAMGTQAAVVYWVSDAIGGSGNYTDGNSWSADFATAYGSAPLATDSHALIGTWGGTLMPTIDSAIGVDVPPTLGIGWDVAYGELNIVTGGSITAHNVNLGYAANNASAGVLNISDGGYMVVAGTLTLGWADAGGTGTVNQSGGTFHLANAPSFIDGIINLSDNALFLINGDQTGLDLVGNGLVNAVDAGSSIQETYNSGTGRTEYTVIPEPATLGMMALVGGSILFVRRKFMT